MKRIIFYVVIVSMVFINYACNGESNHEMEDPQLTEPIELKPKQPDEEVEYKPFVPIEMSVKQGEKARADNRFSFRMFKEISTLSGSNTFFSPLSLNMALGMLYNGASGDTRDEMAEVLSMTDFTESQINEYYQKMTQALQESDPFTGISIANSIWYRNSLPVKQPFIDINQTYFDAKVQALDFDKSDAVDIINSWCAEKTKDKIKGIIDGKISKESMMYFINALYFKGRWESEFQKEATKQAVFTKSDNREQKVNMMEQIRYFLYYADQHLQYVEKPFGNQAFSMAFILPAEEQNLEQLIEYLDDEVWQDIMDNKRAKEVHLKLPRFKVECKLPLQDAVMNVGMKRIFRDMGGFANISDVELVVSEILQKTFVAVDEKGSEAAAVTKIEMEVGSNGGNPNPPIPIPFFANRPFLYLIKEKSTGMILFIGRMDDPKE